MATKAAHGRRFPPTSLDIDYAAAEILAINAGHYIRFNQDRAILKSYTFLCSTIWLWIVRFADLALLLLPCIERPAFFSSVAPWVALLIEIIALAIMLSSFVLSMHLQDKRQLLKEAIYPYIFIIAFTLSVIDMIIYYPLLYNGYYYVRWSRPLRVLFPFALLSGQKIRRVVRNILRTLPNIGNVLFLFLLSVLTFTLLGVGILKNKQITYANGANYFSDYLDTAWDLYVLTTTANNPDVMMPAFNNSMLYVIFFVAYLLVNLYLFMNLLLAVIFSNYKQRLQEEELIILQRQSNAVKTIYSRLTDKDPQSKITYETYRRLMNTMRPGISATIVEAYWKSLGFVNFDSELDIQQLSELLLNLNFDLRERSENQTFLQKTFPSIYASKPSRIIIDFVNTDFFRAIINLLIVSNAICLALSYNELEWLFLSSFVVEAILKMYAIGIREYFHHRWNIFDFVIVFVSTTYSLLTAFVSTLSLNRDILDAILVIRILRLVKLVGNIERFKVIFGTFSKVIPTLITYLRVVFMAYYVFSMIGMEVFQGKIVYSESGTSLDLVCNDIRLNGSEFARAQYCRNNFNDYLSSLILLFELTVVNQWHVLASGFVLVTNKFTRLFFIAFHLCTVIVVLNIFTAFVIDSFLNQYLLSKTKDFPWTSQENLIDERLTQQGYQIIRRNSPAPSNDQTSKKPFDFLKALKSMFVPSIHRQMANVLQTTSEEERALLLRWSADVENNVENILNLKNGITSDHTVS